MSSTDFNLNKSSPAIDSGDPKNTPVYDILGNKRPQVPENAVSYTSFENSFSGWSAWSTSSDNNKVSLSSDESKTGNQSLKISGRTKDFHSAKFIIDKLEVDNSYSIYIYAKLPDGASGTAQLMLRKIVDSEGSSNSLMNPVEIYNDKWTLLSANYTHSSMDSNSYFFVKGPPVVNNEGIDYYIDDFSLVNQGTNEIDFNTIGDIVDIGAYEYIEVDVGDKDGDGIIDSEDNCPETSNSDQKDSDNDNIGDVCDDDIDGDGVINSNDVCPNTPEGAKVDVKGCEVFELPLSNYKVEVGSATCIGNSDGSINLSVEDASFDYTVTITGKDNVTITGDSKTASVSGLAKGTYTVCFKVDGQSSYEQCFDVVVGEPDKLNAFVSVDEDDKKVSIAMSGSNTYNVEINGKRTSVSSDSFDTELNTGLNIIKVYTDLECQGSIEQEVFISEDIHYYPNPTNNDVKVHVGGKDQKVKISVFTTAGALVYTQEQTIEDMTRKTQIDLSKQKTGTYVVVMESETVRKTFKIIRE